MTKIIIAIILCGATLTYWYLAFHDMTEELWESTVGTDFFLVAGSCVGSLIGVGVFLYGGFDVILFFIPDSWGSVNEDGDWVSTRHYIAGALATIASLFVHIVSFLKSKGV